MAKVIWNSFDLTKIKIYRLIYWLRTKKIERTANLVVQFQLIIKHFLLSQRVLCPLVKIL